MRWGDIDAGESASTDIPVVLGDKGEAMIGDGMVCRFKYVGVRFSDEEPEFEESTDCCSRANEGDLTSSFIVADDDDEEAEAVEEPVGCSPEASRDRSSHLPRTASTLFDTRCDGVHLLGDGLDPVGLLVRIFIPPPPDSELWREREAEFDALDEVRSRSRV